MSRVQMHVRVRVNMNTQFFNIVDALNWAALHDLERVLKLADQAVSSWSSSVFSMMFLILS